ncbi:hypothetical protein [Arthrobacter mobilis]|uniref:Uncharacterized protein n=1 Tax=Arthrobacter mobilis TaxID=2724944 RepID=A0A7X6HHG8_9MICC|nr:hypothetical protein [Arthrobacter mobilis]NKX55772.1 hypothetical protein [Arthrobacter mobilis]
MAPEERSAWIMLLATVGAYAAYLVAVLGQAGGLPLAEVPYVPAMLFSIGGAIAASIVLNILAAVALRDGAGRKDQRDREIYRFGEYAGQSFLVLGGVAALVMAMAELPHFWIANAVYLAFVLSAVLASIAKLTAYRRGLPAW